MFDAMAGFLPMILHANKRKLLAMMISSDATMLTNFGTAKGWPIYLMLGNLSKYIRAQPDSGAMHHLSYIPSVCIADGDRGCERVVEIVRGGRGCERCQ